MIRPLVSTELFPFFTKVLLCSPSLPRNGLLWMFSSFVFFPFCTRIWQFQSLWSRIAKLLNCLFAEKDVGKLVIDIKLVYFLPSLPGSPSLPGLGSVAIDPRISGSYPLPLALPPRFLSSGIFAIKQYHSTKDQLSNLKQLAFFWKKLPLAFAQEFWT